MSGQAAMRRMDLEEQLCRAISETLVVELRYDGEFNSRTFEPHCVFHSKSNRNKVNVFGILTSDGNDTFAKKGPRNFEVGKISSLTITGDHFQRPSDFDVTSSMFEGGTICHLKRF